MKPMVFREERKHPMSPNLDDFTRWLPGTGVVYIIEAEGTGFVKVGYTTRNPMTRLAELQTGSPTRLRVAAYWKAEREDETAIHEICGGCRVSGEWFDPHFGMAEWIEEVTAVFDAMAAVRASRNERYTEADLGR